MRRDRHQVRRLLHRRLPLRQTDVRAANHPNLAVRPGLDGGPFDRIVAVSGFLAHGVELALRAIAPARVLVEQHVAALREVLAARRIAVAPEGGRPAVIGRPLQDDGERPVARRQVHLGHEMNAVPHQGLLDVATDTARVASRHGLIRQPAARRRRHQADTGRGRDHRSARHPLALHGLPLYPARRARRSPSRTRTVCLRTGVPCTYLEPPRCYHWETCRPLSSLTRTAQRRPRRPAHPRRGRRAIRTSPPPHGPSLRSRGRPRQRPSPRRWRARRSLP